MKKTLTLSIGFAAVAALLGATATNDAQAYPSWDNGSGVGCVMCHGDFRASPYTSLSDGQNWGDDLHDLHRNDFLAKDCSVCHGSSRTPVLVDRTVGASSNTGLRAMACMGCHGRTQDTNIGAGLRQHHYNAGTTMCSNCHSDANPANYTPVDESVLPEFYSGAWEWAFPAMPVTSCNSGGTENLSGLAVGLDNDGDGDADGADSGCPPTDISGMYQVEFVHSGLCLEVTGSSTSNGGNVRQAPCVSGLHQQWQFILKADGTYRIRNMNSNKCIRAAGGDNWGDAANGGNIQQGNCKWRRSKWYVMPLGGGEYVMRSRRTGQCAEVQGASMTAANVEQQACGAGDEQRFTLL